MRRRWPGRVLRGVVVFVVGLLVVCAAVVGILQVPSWRATLVTKVLSLVGESTGYHVQIARIERLDPWGVELSGIELRALEDAIAVDVERFSVRIEPLLLLRNELRVERLEITHVRGHVNEPPEEPPEEEEDSEPGAFRVRVLWSSLRDVELETSWVEPVAAVSIAELASYGEWGPKPWLWLARAELSVRSSHAELLRLRTQNSRWDTDHGAEVALEGALAGAPLQLLASVAPRREDEEWPRGRLELELAAIAPQTWSTLGLDLKLRQAIRAHVTANSNGNWAGAELTILAPSAEVRLQANASSQVVNAALAVTAENLRQIREDLPDLEVKSQLRARYDYAPDRSEWIAEWHETRVGNTPIPAGEVRAQLKGPSLILRSLHILSLGDSFVARGRWDMQRTEGSLEVELHDAQLARLAFLKNVRAVLSGRAAVSLRPSGALSGNVQLHAREVRVGADAAVETATARVELSGTTAAPYANLALSVTQAKVAEYPLTQLDVRARAEPARIVTDLEAKGPRDRATVHAVLDRATDDALTLGLGGQALIANKSWTFTAQGAQSGVDHSADLSLQVASGPERVEASLRLSAQGDGRLKLRAERIAVPALPRLFARVDVAGSTKTGEVHAEAHLWSDHAAARAEVEADLDIPQKRDGTFDFAQLSQETRLGLHVPVALLTAYAGDKFAGLGGDVEASVEAHGPLARPQAEANVKARVSLTAHPELPPEVATVAMRIDPQRATAELNVQDLQGQLLSASGQLDLPASGQLEELARWTKSNLPPFKLEARLADRRLDTMQGVVAYLAGVYDVKMPVRVGASVSLAGAASGLDGSVRAHVLVHGDKFDPRCALGAQSAVSLEVDLKQNGIEARANAVLDQGGRVEAKVLTRLLLGAEADAERLVQDVQVQADGAGIAVSRLPGLCQLAGGIAAFKLRGTGLNRRPLEADLSMALEDLAAPGGAAVSLHLDASVRGQLLRSSGRFVTNSVQAGDFTLRLPLSSDALPMLALDQPFLGSIRFSRLPLAPFLAVGDALGRPRGSVTGNIQVRGTLADPQPQGSVELKDAGFSIAALAQPLRGINGRVSIQGRTLRIHGLTIRDLDGSMQVDGQAFLRNDGSGRADLTLAANKFPVRQQGVVIGELTTQVRALADLDAQAELRSELRIQGGRLWLTGKRSEKVQSLEENRDLHFVDVKPGEVETKQVKSAVKVKLAALVAKTTKSFWIMHKDFSVEIGVEVTLENAEAFVMKGEAKIERGHLQLLGKPFEIDRGRIAFTGDFPPDPELELHASFEPPTGEKLRVDVTGRASAPVVTFSGAATTAGEALAVLSGSSRTSADSEASTDARNFALGLTAGLLSVAVREELGDWVPIISVESDESGAPTRGRAGFDASKLIPRFMRGFAKGAYVEGILGSTQGGGGSVGVGVKVELALPCDFITSAGYGPGATWGADFEWLP